MSDAAFGQLTLGDTVAVRASPRPGKLISLVPQPNVTDGGAAPPGQPLRDLIAPGELFRVTPGPPGPLLAAEEVAAAVGRPVEATAFQVGILGGVYRGEELTVSLTMATGALGGLSSGPARRWGRPAPGIGDEAWLINRHHTVVFRVATTPARSPSPASHRVPCRRMCCPGWPPPWPAGWPPPWPAISPAAPRRRRSWARAGPGRRDARPAAQVPPLVPAHS